ncbi:histidine kinase, partial [bacterium]|nr:histidine kinase [candidate division CSSED10-310 bacterium]
PAVRTLLQSNRPVAAIVAPSFPAEFGQIDFTVLVGQLRHLGFRWVHEVGFGADLVASRMRRLLDEFPDKRYISSACPAVFGFIKRYHPELIPEVAPVVSPMIATARVLRRLHGDRIHIVFIGPCISKKIEADSREVGGEIEDVLTFGELREMFGEALRDGTEINPSDFDPPHAGRGSLFPVGRGLLEAADIREDLLRDDVISANGRANFIDAVMEFSSGDVRARFLDVLCCDGCIMGSGMTIRDPLFKRRNRISEYVRSVLDQRDQRVWQNYMDQFDDLDLSRTFIPNDQRITPPDDAQIRRVLADMGKIHPWDELNCGACGYETCREHAVAICKGLAESEMCLPYSIERLHKTVAELNESNTKLASTREALIQSEKLASMGQLSAGIAHEVNNPLGVVLMYAHLLREEIEEGSELHEDLQMIVEHADRAKKIVSGLLHFARQNKISLKRTNIPELIEDCLKSVQVPASVTVRMENHMGDPTADVDRDQMMQVILNFVSNSLTAMPDGGTLTIQTDDTDGDVTIRVRDTGKGIPRELRSKIFEPFFTTKGIGQGTGLGLAITYGIVKMHRGRLDVESSTEDEPGPTGSIFSVTLPRRNTGTEVPVQSEK